MTSDEPNSNLRRHRIERRRLLQVAGAGLGGFATTTLGSDSARAASACAEGPFERTYTAETVTLSKVATDRKQRNDEATIARPPPTRRFADERERRADATGAQRAPESNGLLTVGAEYDGVYDTTTLPFFGQKPVAPPSDSQLAVGRSKVVQAINHELAIFDQRSGELEAEIPFGRLFDPIISETEFVADVPIVADPRARYDPQAERFVLSAFYIHAPTWTGAWFLAVSDGKNPNGRWHLYRIPTHSGNWPDYPALGIGPDAIYLTAETVPLSGSFPETYDVELAVLDKDAAYDGAAVTTNHFTGLLQTNGLQVTVQPAFQPDAADSEPYYLLSSQLAANQFTFWEVTDPLDDPSLDCFELDVEPFLSPPPARQPGTDVRISTIGSRLLNVDYDAGSLWTAHNVGYDWDDGTDETVVAVRWYEIDASSRELVQYGTYGEPGTSYFYPHIRSTGDRTLLVHDISGPDTFPGIAVAGRRSDAPAGEMEDALVVREGESPMDHPTTFGSRDPVWWQDYTGASVHPRTGRFWITAEYSPSVDVPSNGDAPDEYRTHIAEISFEAEENRDDGRQR